MAETRVRGRKQKPSVPDLEFAQRCTDLTAIAAHNGLYQANCLHQSLPLCRLLRLYGLHVQLRIGVLPGFRPFQAHAWVELDGVPLGKQPVTQYVVFNQLTPKPGGIELV